MIIEKAVDGGRMESPEHGDFDINVTLAYDTSDPFAVRLILADKHTDEDGCAVTWHLSRDNLIAVLAGSGDRVNSVGGGDATMYGSPLSVRILLSNPREGSGTVVIPRSRLRQFLTLTKAEVPPGREDEYYDADAEIAALLAGRIGGGGHPERAE